MLFYVEDYLPTSIISHNKCPLFHSSPTSCFLTTCKLVMVAYLDAPLAIQNILEVLMDLRRLPLDVIVD